VWIWIFGSPLSPFWLASDVFVRLFRWLQSVVACRTDLDVEKPRELQDSRFSIRNCASTWLT
jgi:hypothetical protein